MRRRRMETCRTPPSRGVALGNLGNAVVASFGLAAVLAVSARAFTVVKLAGAAYLIYLGIRELRRARHAIGERTRPPSPERGLFAMDFWWRDSRSAR